MNSPPKKAQPEDFPTTGDDPSEAGGIRGFTGLTGPIGITGPTGITGPIRPPVERKEPFRLGFFSRLAHQFLGHGPAGAPPDAASNIAEAVRMGMTGPMGGNGFPGPVGDELPAAAGQWRDGLGPVGNDELPGPAGNPVLIREVPAGRAGLDQSIIATFPVVPGNTLVVQKDDQDCLELLEEQASKDETVHDCSICQETYQEDCLVMTIPCLHRFHQNCITRWFDAHTTCPICRTDFAVIPIRDII